MEEAGLKASATFKKEERRKEKGPAGDAPGLCLSEGGKFLFEGKGEVEDQVAYGDAQGKFAGFGVADVPELAGGFLTLGEIGGFQSHGADGSGFVVEAEVVVHGGGVVGHGCNLRSG